MVVIVVMAARLSWPPEPPLAQRFPKRRLIAVYEPRSATSRRKTFQTELVQAFAHADEVVVGKLFDPSKIPAAERSDPERLALDLHRGGTKAAYIPEVEVIVKQLAQNTAPGDVVCVMSSGSFDGLHDKLLDEIGDAMRPAHREDMTAVRGMLAAAGLEEPARDDQQGSDRDASHRPTRRRAPGRSPARRTAADRRAARRRRSA